MSAITCNNKIILHCHFKKGKPNSADLVQTLKNAVSDKGVHFWLTEILGKIQ